MKEEKDKLCDFMQEVFEDYEVAPDPEDWNRIEKALSEIKGRRILPFIIWAAAACLVLLLAVYTGGILRHSENNHPLTAVNEHKADKTLSLLNAKSTAKESAHTGSDIQSLSTNQPSEKINQSKVKGVTVATVQENKTVNEAKTINHVAAIKTIQHAISKPVKRLIRTTKTTETQQTLLASNQTKQTPLVDSKDKTITVSTNQPVDVLSRTENDNLLVHTIIPKTIESIKYSSKPLRYNWTDLYGYESIKFVDWVPNFRRIKIDGLSLCNNSGLILQASGKETMSYSGAFASQLTTNMYNNSVKVFNNSFLVSSNIGNLFQNNSRDFLPPITYGLNINISNYYNWSIETGIQYARLQSSGTVSINSSNAIQFTTSFGYKVDESLYYIGVPLIVNYTFAQKRKTSFYISGGISIEKGLIAKYKATPVDNFPGMVPIYSHNAISGLQFSMYSGIGISYKFIPHFEFFGQPSLTNYFNTVGKNNTVYSAHPFIFNLRTGIRYTIK